MRKQEGWENIMNKKEVEKQEKGQNEYRPRDLIQDWLYFTIYILESGLQQFQKKNGRTFIFQLIGWTNSSNQIYLCIFFEINNSSMGNSETIIKRKQFLHQVQQQKKVFAFRDNFPPLKSIGPIVCIEDTPTEDDSFFLQSSNDIKKSKKKKRNKPIHQNQNKNVSFQIQPQANYQKIQVKWDRFIKMKRRSFLNDYKVIRKIGKGGYGTVFKVQSKNGVAKAAKRIQKGGLSQEEHENLLMQMSIMIDLDHPNIIKLHEVYDEVVAYVLILQLCQGGDLLEQILNTKITEKEAKMITKQILHALNYLHQKNIVHRDIKPENMLLQEGTSMIKIIDFGISTHKSSNFFLTTRVGTPYYLAPEVVNRKYDEKCDIWSLGIVLYIIIYKSVPFKGSDTASILQNISNKEVCYESPIKFCFSYDSVNFLKKLLCRNVSNRISAAQALRDPWLESLQKQNLTKKQIVLERIQQFHFKNKLEAVVYTYIVCQILTNKEKLQLFEVFKMIDKKKDGVIDIGELTQALKQVTKDKISEQKIVFIRDYLDTNCSGKIDYTQFIVGAIDYGTKVQKKHLEQAFQYFDIDKSGEITFEQVSKFLQDKVKTKEEIKQLFSQVDKNGDGIISKQQFVELLAFKKMSQIST